MLTLADAERSYLLTAAPGALATDSLQDLQAKFWTKTATESLADAETRYLKALLTNEVAGDTLADLRRKDLIIKTGATNGSDSELKALYLGVPTVKNLLTANQASGGDTLGTTDGMSTEGNGAIARSTVAAKSGTGSFLVTWNELDIYSSGARVSLSFSAGVVYTVTTSFKNGTGTRDIFGFTLYDGSGWTPKIKTIPNGEWGTVTHSFIAPINTSAGALYFGPGEAGSIADTFYIDEIGHWIGVGTEWSMP